MNFGEHDRSQSTATQLIIHGLIYYFLFYLFLLRQENANPLCAAHVGPILVWNLSSKMCLSNFYCHIWLLHCIWIRIAQRFIPVIVFSIKTTNIIASASGLRQYGCSAVSKWKTVCTRMSYSTRRQYGWFWYCWISPVISATLRLLLKLMSSLPWRFRKSGLPSSVFRMLVR